MCFPVLQLFVGLGFPYEGPAPLEAIANGCAFLNPKFNPPKSSKNTDFFIGKPTLREVSIERIPLSLRVLCLSVYGRVAHVCRHVCSGQRVKCGVPPAPRCHFTLFTKAESFTDVTTLACPGIPCLHLLGSMTKSRLPCPPCFFDMC